MQSEMAKLFVNSGDPDQTPLSLSLSELGNGNLSSFHLYVFLLLFFCFLLFFLFLQICKLATDDDSQ